MVLENKIKFNEVYLLYYGCMCIIIYDKKKCVMIINWCGLYYLEFEFFKIIVWYVRKNYKLNKVVF